MICKELIEKGICKANCCGVVPVSRELCKKELYQREVTEIIELDDELYPMTENMHCAFLKRDYSCNIYEQRPEICKNYGIIEELPCPFINIKGRLRSPAKQRRMTRIITHQINDALKKLKDKSNGKTFLPQMRSRELS